MDRLATYATLIETLSEKFIFNENAGTYTYTINVNTNNQTMKSLTTHLRSELFDDLATSVFINTNNDNARNGIGYENVKSSIRKSIVKTNLVMLMNELKTKSNSTTPSSRLSASSIGSDENGSPIIRYATCHGQTNIPNLYMSDQLYNDNGEIESTWYQYFDSSGQLLSTFIHHTNDYSVRTYGKLGQCIRMVNGSILPHPLNRLPRAYNNYRLSTTVGVGIIDFINVTTRWMESMHINNDEIDYQEIKNKTPEQMSNGYKEFSLRMRDRRIVSSSAIYADDNIRTICGKTISINQESICEHSCLVIALAIGICSSVTLVNECHACNCGLIYKSLTHVAICTIFNHHMSKTDDINATIGEGRIMHKKTRERGDNVRRAGISSRKYTSRETYRDGCTSDLL